MLGDSGGDRVSDPGEEDRMGLMISREAKGVDTGVLRKWRVASGLWESHSPAPPNVPTWIIAPALGPYS